MSETSTEENHDSVEDIILGFRRQFEEKFGTSWLSACYPVNLKLIHFPAEDNYWKGFAFSKLKRLLEYSLPEYPDDWRDMVSGDPCPSTDAVVSLLGDNLVRNNGDRKPDTFKGKYVVVCCFHLPVPWGTDYFQRFLDLCNELYSMRDNFEMVVVAQMSPLADTQAVFDHFFSGFHESVLTVPYEDSKRRHHICNLLDLSPHLDRFPCLFLDTDGSVLPPLVKCNIMEDYGAEAFPFTREIVDRITAKHEQLWRNGTLEQLLRPYESSPDDVFVHRFNDPSEVVSISQLGKKYVWLYLCIDGQIIPRLNYVHKQCREKQLDVEIVVLYCPLNDSPSFFQEEMDGLMQESNVCGWWCLPFNNSVSLRFSRLTQNYRYSAFNLNNIEDKVIVVGPDGGILDMYGGKMMLYNSINAYPFTRKAQMDMQMGKLREVTLESVLVDDIFRGNDRSDVISVGELVGKKRVIIYKTSLRCLYGYGDGLVSQYREMKANEGSDEFEVVFINTDPEEQVKDSDELPWEEEEFEDTEVGEEEEEEEEEEEQEEEVEEEEWEEDEAWKTSAMPWYVYPLNGTRSESLIKLMKFRTESICYGFGLDGQICSFGNWIRLDDTICKDLNQLHYSEDYREI